MSLRKAINDKCRDCIYDPQSGLGNWRQQVTLCTIKACPLWMVRPLSSPRRSGPDLAPEQTMDGEIEAGAPCN